jgi:hypothetical protein
MNTTNPQIVTDTTHVPPILDMTQIKESLRILVASLNKSAKGGIYTLDEAYIIKVSLSNIEKTVEVFEQYQNNHIKENNKDDK